MAERIQVELVDDIDGSRAQHTVTFALDGVTYEIDLSERHARDLRSVFARYIASARGAEEQAPRTTKQQEREERRARQENRQLTEQIRGAAQRSRDRHKQDQDVGTTGGRATEDTVAEDNVEVDLLNGDQQSPAPATSAVDAPGDDRSERRDDEHEASAGTEDEDSRRVPAVSLPQFSSASD